MYYYPSIIQINQLFELYHTFIIFQKNKSENAFEIEWLLKINYVNKLHRFFISIPSLFKLLISKN